MDNNTKQKLIQIAAALAAALTFYYIASPYQNCLRADDNWGGQTYACREATVW
jgi:hypothetical protein